ncbi:MAG: sensor domain-containing diguanylate cyclase [Candidatus Omnitrophica bacterium]|nr:sensor domain-containing diguanylate cyclase [Candidatus Omnitrophota bacterium]
MSLKIQDSQEAMNVLKDINFKERKSRIALYEKIARYKGLKKIIEEINTNSSLDFVAEYLVSVAFSTIAANRGACILYLLNPQTQKLSMYKTKKEEKNLIVKSKEGDTFDFWVLRHLSPLLVEDGRDDFRFDLEKIKSYKERPVVSVVSSPFISEHSFLGLLRLDSMRAKAYSQDDLRFLVTICDIGAVALENAMLVSRTQDLAIHDGLTSFYRKGYFMDRLKEECKRSARQNKTFSLLMLDIDHFKDFNDTYGHTAGDIVLKEISHNIMELLKEKSAVISRFGGEEFCMILTGMERAKAEETAEQIREKIGATKINLRGKQLNVTVSIGVVNFPSTDKDEMELIIKADRAMYEAKQKGRNRVIAA